MVGTGMRVGPLVGGEAADVEENEADAGKDGEEVHPDDGAKRGEKGPEGGLLDDGSLEEDADAGGHEGMGKVDHLFPFRGDR